MRSARASARGVTLKTPWLAVRPLPRPLSRSKAAREGAMHLVFARSSPARRTRRRCGSVGATSRKMLRGVHREYSPLLQLCCGRGAGGEGGESRGFQTNSAGQRTGVAHLVGRAGDGGSVASQARGAFFAESAQASAPGPACAVHSDSPSPHPPKSVRGAGTSRHPSPEFRAGLTRGSSDPATRPVHAGAHYLRGRASVWRP